jgi:GNAT superfamily N-acetyltransferase
MKIRFLIPEDAGDGLVCGSRLSSVTPEAFSASLDEYRSLTLEDIRKRLWSDEDAFVVGAFEDGRLIGVAGFYREKGAKSHHKGSILGVYVTPRSRGAGIGKKIMQTLLERGSTIEGVEQLLLSVAATPTSAIRHSPLPLSRF